MIKNNYFYTSLLLFVSILLSQHVFGQGSSGVKGVILDIETLKPLAGVTVSVSGTQHRGTSNTLGEFFISLPKDPSKDYTIVASMVGYNPDSTTFMVATDEPTLVSISLLGENSVLDEVVVVRRRERVSEAVLLDMRRQSNVMVEMIGAQELSRKGVGDAASALAKMSGISRMAGSSQIYVRGLGDRYNTTTLNGLPMPSNDPERKNIDLDLFSTDIVDYIAIDKVYSAYMSGDYAGGNVDIQSKHYTGDGFLELSIGGTSNTNTIDQWDNFSFQQGPTVAGFVNYGVPNDPLGGWNFEHSLNPVSRQPIAGSFGVTGGKSFRFRGGSRLSLFGTAKYGNDYNYLEGVNRESSAGGEQIKDFDVIRFGYTTNTTGMLNANFQLNQSNRFSYNFLFINSSDQYRATYSGFIRDMAEDGTGIFQRSTFRQNKLFVNQLLGTHVLNDRLDVEWGLSVNNVVSTMPDRMQNITRFNDDLGYRVLARNKPSDNHRYYQDLSEKDYALNLAGNYKIGESGNEKGTITIGYNGKIKRREFEDIQFNFQINEPGAQQEVDPNNLDAFFNEQNRYQSEDDPRFFTIQGFSSDFPQVYTGEQNVHAVYGAVDYQLMDKLIGVVGLRYENIKQSIYYLTNLDRSGTTNTFTRNGLLPSLNLKYELTEKQNLRLGASRTYTLPQFKERALFIYEKDAVETIQGNPDLYPSQDYNLDLKWEAFPKISEMLSFTVFGKYIVDPINQITLASATNDISFVNSGDWGTVFGAEVEVKKDVFDFDNGASVLSVGGNAAYMHTNQEIDPEKVSNETRYSLNTTDDRVAFTGASDFIANADVSYSRRWSNQSNIMATLVYNYYSDRIYALGNLGKGNQIDQGVSILDFILKYKVNRRFGIDASAKNLLNPTYERIQDNANAPVTIASYKNGIWFSLGFKYTL